MNERERLIELLNQKCYDDWYSNEDIADHLLANGVTIPVRCRDCKHGRPPRFNTSPEMYLKQDSVVCQCSDVVGDEFMIYKPTHFCSYGERKEK